MCNKINSFEFQTLKHDRLDLFVQIIYENYCSDLHSIRNTYT